MSIRKLTVPAVVWVGASVGCHFEYQAKVECVPCRGGPNVESEGDWSCSKDGATVSAQEQCPILHTPNTSKAPTFAERLVLNLSGCPDDRTASLPEFTLEVKNLIGERAVTTVEPQVVAAADGPTCPPLKLDVKVTVFQDVPVAECPGPMGVEVSYQKYISEGVYEATTLTGTVPVGGKHEFVCVDTGVTDFGKVGTISVRVYSDLNCVGEMPLAIGQAYSQIPADGSRLEVRANLETLTFEDEIIAPAASATNTAAAATRPALVPTPDPMFTPRRP